MKKSTQIALYTLGVLTRTALFFFMGCVAVGVPLYLKAAYSYDYHDTPYPDLPKWVNAALVSTALLCVLAVDRLCRRKSWLFRGSALTVSMAPFYYAIFPLLISMDSPYYNLETDYSNMLPVWLVSLGLFVAISFGTEFVRSVLYKHSTCRTNRQNPQSQPSDLG